MAAGNSKIIYGTEVLMDITDTTAEASTVLLGKKFYGKDGGAVTGTCTFDSDTTDANATAAEILATKTAYINKNKVTGSMVNNGAVTGTIATKAGVYTVPAGYHDGSGTVQIDADQQALLIPASIKAGCTILGVLGTYTGESITAQSKTVTPTKAGSTVTPDTGYDYLAQVTINPIAFSRTLNAQGGYTCTIAG